MLTGFIRLRATEQEDKKRTKKEKVASLIMNRRPKRKK